MALKDDLRKKVRQVFADQWTKRDGNVVPESEGVGLGNDGVLLDAAVLYADLTGSTDMVDRKKAHFAAEVYKSYLHCAAKLIQAEGGSVTAYDGDRIMGVFIGSSKCTCAARCGLKLNWAVRNIVNPTLKEQYTKSTYAVRQIVGVDTSQLWVARTGVRGSNDLVWVGKAANYAAKLTELNADFPTWITHRVFDVMHKSVKVSTSGKEMWERRSWTAMNKLTVYRSNWTWPL